MKKKNQPHKYPRPGPSLLSLLLLFFLYLLHGTRDWCDSQLVIHCIPPSQARGCPLWWLQYPGGKDTQEKRTWNDAKRTMPGSGTGYLLWDAFNSPVSRCWLEAMALSMPGSGSRSRPVLPALPHKVDGSRPCWTVPTPPPSSDGSRGRPQNS